MSKDKLFKFMDLQNLDKYFEFEILTPVTMKNMVFWL
jgi:hypothetical protein